MNENTQPSDSTWDNSLSNEPAEPQVEETSPFLPDDDEDPEGFTFNWIPLLIAVGYILLNIQQGGWSFYLYLAIVVIIHEMGHVVMGKAFGCVIRRMQVFFFSFVTYKPPYKEGASWWRNITWSLGVLPWGGFTVFKSRLSDDELSAATPLHSAQSPYLEDKKAWQRLLIAAGGVLFNLATFLLLFIFMSVTDLISEGIFMVAMLSIILAVLNIIPIYPLDGGTVLLSVYEMITGKRPSQQFTRILGWIGFAFIILFFFIYTGWMTPIFDFFHNLLMG